MATELSRNAVIKTYARWAPVYDVVFGSVFEHARRMAVEASERVGGRILEVGVGTGISLPYYSARSRVVRHRYLRADAEGGATPGDRRAGWSTSSCSSVMDAENLEFPDASFDVVVAQYVVNTVPHPEIALDEFLRVLRPGGELVIVNRVGARRAARARRSSTCSSRSRNGSAGGPSFRGRASSAGPSRSPAALIERRPVPPLGHFSLIRFGKLGAGSHAEQHRSIGSA